MDEETTYKVSYVVEHGTHPGAIMNSDRKPEIGEEVSFNGLVFEVIEVAELMPAWAGFGFLHVTCRYLRDAAEDEE